MEGSHNHMAETADWYYDSTAELAGVIPEPQRSSWRIAERDGVIQRPRGQ